MHYCSGTQRYRETDIGTMAPEKIIVMLYERVVRDLEQALEAFQGGDRREVTRLVLHSQAIITELRGALDHTAGGEVAANLEDLYDWLFRQHLSLLADPRAAGLEDCLKVVAPLLEAWRTIPAGSAAEAARTRILRMEAAASGADPATRPGEPGGAPAPDRRPLSLTV